MNEKRFRKLQGYMADNNRNYNNGDVYAMDFTEVEDMLNELYEENKQLRKQIQNYEKLLSNSYVGEEETLDGFVGKYVIWEDELQEYKNKNEMIGDE